MMKVYHIKQLVKSILFNLRGMKRCIKLKLFLVALIIIVQGVHSGTAFTSIRLGKQINQSRNKPNNFDYQNNHRYLIAKLSIALSITNILLLISFTVRKLLFPNQYGILYKIMLIIIIFIQILLVMDSSYRFYQRNDPFQIKDSISISGTYEDLKQRLLILTSLQFGLSLLFELGGIIIFSRELYQGGQVERRNPYGVHPLGNQEEGHMIEMRQQ